MRARKGGFIALAVGLAALVGGPGVSGQPAASKPEWVYAHDLRVRKGGAKDFDKDTPKIGVEFFKDSAAGALVAISQAGYLAVAPGAPADGEKKAQWLFAHDLRARKGAEEKFTKDTTKYGVEAFKDTGSGRILYVSQAGSIALAPAPEAVGTDKEPVWHHALILKVRGPNEEQFTASTRKFGVEVFKDGNTGGLIYICDTGAITAAPAPPQPPQPDMVKAPKALYGLTLRVRKSNEADFGPKTKQVGVEVFEDENTGGLIYISETGSIAAAPKPADVKSGQGVSWRHAMTLKARPGGVNEFDKAKQYGVEVFQDNNTGHLIFVSDVGAIAVLAKAK